MRARDLRWVIVAGLAGVLLSGCSLTLLRSGNPSEEFSNVVDRYFSGAYSVEPKPDSLHPFPWLALNADSLRAKEAASALRELYAVDTSGLSVDERIDWLQMEATLRRTERDVALQRPSRTPIQYLTVGSLFWQLSGRDSLKTSEWEEILKTLRNVPDAIELGRKQLKDPPPLWITLAVRTARQYMDLLSGAFVGKVDVAAPASIKDSLHTAGRTASDAIAGYARFLSDSLRPGKENAWSVGREYYDWLLANVHFLPYTAETMISEGWRIHRETKTALEQLARRIDSSKTWRRLVEEMKQRHPTPGRISEAYKHASDRVRSFLVTEGLIDIPQPETLLFVPTPPSLRDTYAWGGYGGIVDQEGKAVGRFFVTDVVPGMTPEEVGEKLKVQNYGWIDVIALHEGYPGHHLQSVYARKNPSKVRSRLGSTYFGEGWALYCEAWMARSGFYRNADDSLAWLQMRLWRTTRVIVDPSIHTGAMTYDQAVQFMVDEIGLERSAAEAEVNRYTTWPTQAPSYIIGWLEIEKLEQQVRAMQGSRFNEKDFLERVLRAGSLPLDLMKRAVLNTYSP